MASSKVLAAMAALPCALSSSADMVVGRVDVRCWMMFRVSRDLMQAWYAVIGKN
jgi:hypothetical protein